MIRAEGLLCKGLDDDPWALDAAIAALREIVASEPENFFAQLESADALRARFRCSDDAAEALATAAAFLNRAPLGDATADLAAYVASNAAALQREQRRAVMDMQRIARIEVPSASDVYVMVTLLKQLGPAAVALAEGVVAASIERDPSDEYMQLARAELTWGQATWDRAGELYRGLDQRCARENKSTAPCAIARDRVRQLARVGQYPGSFEGKRQP